MGRSQEAVPKPSVPETTSAENLVRYIGGKCLTTGRGEAWREIKASIIALPPIVDALHMPSVSEAVLVDNVR